MANPSGKSVLQQSAQGTYVGTGAAVQVKLGFRPRILIVYNETDGDVCWLVIRGLADGKAVQIDTAVSLLASNGATLTEAGFTAGSSMSESAKTMRFFAL